MQKLRQLNKRQNNSIQGSLFCTACNGKKKFQYAKQGRVEIVTCPICKGTGLGTFKGKLKQ